MQDTLLLATNNLGKIREFIELCKDLPFKIVSCGDFPELASFEVNETGVTFAENALIKAKAYSLKTGLLSVADDSGLEVVALGNKPGVQSARWHNGTDADRCLALLDSMANIQDRRASFTSVICLYDPKLDKSTCFTGTVSGTIARHLEGESGFGYDPIFVPSGFNQSFAALGQTVKNSISHRSKALGLLKNFLVSEQQKELYGTNSV